MAKAKKRANPRLGRERPPNLRQVGAQEQRACSSCEHFMGQYCQRHQWPVKPFHVCDTWTEKVEERTDDQVRRDKANEVVMNGAKNITIRVDPGGAGA